ILHAHVGGSAELLPTDFREVQKSERVEPVRHRHHDYAVLTSELAAVVEDGIAGPGAKPTAMQPDHYGTAAVAGRAGRPDVEEQTVFTGGARTDQRVSDFRHHAAK